jgi:multimeric flavodoxin WrbA
MKRNDKLILGICGSPRVGSTDYLVRYALKILEDKGFKTEYQSVSAKKIAPCFHCDYCIDNKKCVNEDDMYPIYDLLQKASGIIIGSPMHNGGISAQTKCVMDRTRALEAIDYDILRGKIGMSITVGGDRVGGQELAIQEINTYYILHGIIPVSGGPFGSNLGASFWSKDSVEEVKKDEYGFKTLNKTLKQFIKFLDKYV